MTLKKIRKSQRKNRLALACRTFLPIEAYHSSRSLLFKTTFIESPIKKPPTNPTFTDSSLNS